SETLAEHERWVNLYQRHRGAMAMASPGASPAPAGGASPGPAAHGVPGPASSPGAPRGSAPPPPGRLWPTPLAAPPRGPATGRGGLRYADNGCRSSSPPDPLMGVRTPSDETPEVFAPVGPRPLSAVLLALVLFFALISNGRPIGAGDTRPTERVAASLVRERN